MAKPDLVDYQDISQMTGHQVTHLRVLNSRGAMPDQAHPRHPVWRTSEIVRWIKNDDRATPTRDMGR